MGFDLSKIGVVKNIPKVSFLDYSGLLVAEPKWGKTTMASKYPNAIIIPFEKGYYATVSNVLEDLTCWEDFLDFIDNLEDHRDEIGDSVKTLVFDTINSAWDMLEPYTLKQLGILDGRKYSKPSDVPHGQFYPARDNYLKDALRRVLNLGFLPLFVTHNEVKTITPKNGQSYQIYSSTMPDRLEKIIAPLVSYIVFGERTIAEDEFGNQVPKRVLKLRSTDVPTGGSRVRLDDDILFDTEDEAMEQFQQAFKLKMQEKLKEAGITENIDKIEEKQNKERKEKVKQYIEEKKSPSNEELCKIIQEKFAKATSEIQVQISAILKENGITSFSEPDRIDKEVLLSMAKILE